MHAFEANVFVFSSIWCQEPTDAEWNLLKARTQPMIEAAEAAGVTLAQEPEPNFLIGSTAAMHHFMELVPSPRLGVNMDIGHCFLRDPDPMAAIRSLKGRIVHCHVENMPKGEHRHLPPDEGDMNLAEYFDVLAEIGFRGGMALDLYKVDYLAVAERTLPMLRQLRDAALAKAKG
jgi:sugar phosphate isomerase/epimerase